MICYPLVVVTRGKKGKLPIIPNLAAIFFYGALKNDSAANPSPRHIKRQARLFDHA
jgi:hypothetical protein